MLENKNLIILILIMGVLISGCVSPHEEAPEIEKIEERMKKMQMQGEEILKNDTKFRNIEGWEKSKINITSFGCSNGICDAIFEINVENKSYVAWIDMFGKKVLTIKEIRENGDCRDINRSKLLNISLEDESVKKIIGGTIYTLSGHGIGCMGGHMFGTLTLNVGGFYGIGGKTYTIFIDVSDKKVLSILKH